MRQEKAELIYLWVLRQEWQHHMMRRSPREQALLARLDDLLNRTEYCEASLGEQYTMGGTGWLADMRAMALRHEKLMYLLASSGTAWGAGRATATTRQAFDNAVRRVDREAAAEDVRVHPKLAGRPHDYLGHEADYQSALHAFRVHLSELARYAIRSLPDGVLDRLIPYLPDCWWHQ